MSSTMARKPKPSVPIPTPEHLRWSKLLKKLRKRKGWNQVKAAEELGITQGNISNIERCRYIPSGPLQKLINLRLSGNS